MCERKTSPDIANVAFWLGGITMNHESQSNVITKNIIEAYLLINRYILLLQLQVTTTNSTTISCRDHTYYTCAKANVSLETPSTVNNGQVKSNLKLRCVMAHCLTTSVFL